MSSLSPADGPVDVLSREIRRLTAKCVLEHQKTKDAQGNVKRLEPLAALVPGLRKKVSDLKLELSATTLQLHEANANLASSRKSLIESDFAAGRALVEAEQRLVACEDEGAAAAQIASRELKDATDELKEVKQQLAAAEMKSSSALQHAEEKMAQMENRNSVLSQAEKKSTAALRDAEKRLVDAEVSHRASLQEAEQKLTEVETKLATACREAEQKLADSESKRRSTGQEAEKNLAGVETKSCSACRKVENQLKDAEAKNAFALQTAEKKLAQAERKSAIALRNAEKNLKDAETKFSDALKSAEQKAEDATSRLDAALKNSEIALTDAVKKSPVATHDVEQKLSESLATLRKAEKMAKEARNQRDEAISRTNRTVADLSAKVAAAEGEAQTWKQSSLECERKLAIAVAKLDAGGGVAPAMGNTFSPAPLGASVLGYPADRHQGSDVASESRSRFTLNLPFQIDQLEPRSTQSLDGVDEVPIPRSEMPPRKRRRNNLEEGLKAKDTRSAVANRPRGSARTTHLKGGENGDGESTQSGEEFCTAEEYAHADTEMESVDRPRVTVGSRAISPPCRDEADGDGQSGVIASEKVRGQTQSGAVRPKKSSRLSTASQPKGFQKIATSKRKGQSVNGLVKDGRAVSGKSDATGSSPAPGARKAVLHRRAVAQPSKIGMSKATPESAITNEFKSIPQKLSGGRPARRRKEISYDYSVGSPEATGGRPARKRKEISYDYSIGSPEVTGGRPARRRKEVSYDYSVGSGRDVCKDMLR